MENAYSLYFYFRPITDYSLKKIRKLLEVVKLGSQTFLRMRSIDYKHNIVSIKQTNKPTILVVFITIVHSQGEGYKYYVLIHCNDVTPKSIASSNIIGDNIVSSVCTLIYERLFRKLKMFRTIFRSIRFKL